jgi:hypothetical protein
MSYIHNGLDDTLFRTLSTGIRNIERCEADTDHNIFWLRLQPS